MAYFTQIIANGLHNGALYAVLAYGYALIYMVTRRANVAHGAVFAFAGQMTVLATSFAYNSLIFTFAASLAFGISVAIFLSAIVALVLAHVIIPRFLSQSQNMVIAASLAVSIVLTEGARIGSDTRDYWLPPIWSQQLQLLPVPDAPAITQLQALNLVIMVFMLVAADFVLRHTSAGRNLRAVADDPKAASLCGTNAGAVIRNTVFAGSVLAIIAGILAVLYFGNMSFGAGLIYGLKVLFIAAAGGFSSPARAAAGAFLFGEAEALWDGYFPIAWRELVFFAGLTLLLCLSREGREQAEPAIKS